MGDPSVAALAAHHDRIRACRACAYAHAPRPVVAGQPAARIFVVGQAPGKTEEQLGEPWRGPAGKRLMRWMTDTVGFESPEAFRAQAYFAAVTRCFPGPAKGGHGDARPTPGEVARCAPYLSEELAIVRPPVIVLVGGLAIERFIGKVRLDEAIGRVFPQRFDTFSTRLVPLPHPSGASTWLNHPTHQALLQDWLEALRGIILAEGLATLAR
jgi:uracil-DNA glycosylase